MPRPAAASVRFSPPAAAAAAACCPGHVRLPGQPAGHTAGSTTPAPALSTAAPYRAPTSTPVPGGRPWLSRSGSGPGSRSPAATRPVPPALPLMHARNDPGQPLNVVGQRHAASLEHPRALIPWVAGRQGRSEQPERRSFPPHRRDQRRHGARPRPRAGGSPPQPLERRPCRPRLRAPGPAQPAAPRTRQPRQPAPAPPGPRRARPPGPRHPQRRPHDGAHSPSRSASSSPSVSSQPTSPSVTLVRIAASRAFCAPYSWFATQQTVGGVTQRHRKPGGHQPGRDRPPNRHRL
jgi:hypothetical protein